MDELEKAIEALRREPHIEQCNLTLRVRDFLSAWDATREVREAEREFIEAYLDLDSKDLDLRMRAFDRLRELRKPKPRLIVVPDSAGTWSVMDRERRLGASEPWLARFQNRADAEEWAAAQEQRP